MVVGCFARRALEFCIFALTSGWAGAGTRCHAVAGPVGSQLAPMCSWARCPLCWASGGMVRGRCRGDSLHVRLWACGCVLCATCFWRAGWGCGRGPRVFGLSRKRGCAVFGFAVQRVFWQSCWVCSAFVLCSCLLPGAMPGKSNCRQVCFCATNSETLAFGAWLIGITGDRASFSLLGAPALKMLASTSVWQAESTAMCWASPVSSLICARLARVCFRSGVGGGCYFHHGTASLLQKKVRGTWKKH